jgi:hypothetical protein
MVISNGRPDPDAERESVTLKCVNPGCGEDAETVWLGMSLCDRCQDVAFELPRELIGDGVLVTWLMYVDDAMAWLKDHVEQPNLHQGMVLACAVAAFEHHSTTVMNREELAQIDALLEQYLRSRRRGTKG